MVPGPKEVEDDATHTRLIPTLVWAVFGAVIYTAPAQAEPSQRCTDHFVDSDSIDCSSFDPTWTFHDDFTDTYDVDGTVTLTRTAHRTGWSNIGNSTPTRSTGSPGSPPRAQPLRGIASDEDFCRAIA
jgi:hypothetical protein